MNKIQFKELIKEWVESNLEYQEGVFVSSYDLYDLFLRDKNIAKKELSLIMFTKQVLKALPQGVKKAQRRVGGDPVRGYLNLQCLLDISLNKSVYPIGNFNKSNIVVEDFFKFKVLTEDSRGNVQEETVTENGTFVPEFVTDLSQITFEEFYEDFYKRILTTTYKIALGVNREILVLYYILGSRMLIYQSYYGDKLIDRLSEKLRQQFPEKKGYSTTNLRRMILFAKKISLKDFENFVGLPWRHIITLLKECNTKEERIFYGECVRKYGWSSGVLGVFIQSRLFYRDNKVESNYEQFLPLEHSRVLTKFLRNPIVLDFIPIKNILLERDLEKVIVDSLERFIVELGGDYRFVGRQVDFTIGDTTYYVDLLFYHEILKCYMVIELKVDKFKPEYLGQLVNYINLVNKYKKEEKDNPSVGFLLCKSSKGLEVQMSLEGITHPIGVGNYMLSKFIENLKDRFSKEFQSLVEDSEDDEKEDETDV